MPAFSRFLQGPRFFGETSRASTRATMSDTSHSRSKTPAAMAGVTRSVLWMRTAIRSLYLSVTAAIRSTEKPCLKIDKSAYPDGVRHPDEAKYHAAAIYEAGPGPPHRAIDRGGADCIGGNLSTNAGGNRVIRYGMAREMVLGLEVVLIDGTRVTEPEQSGAPSRAPTPSTCSSRRRGATLPIPNGSRTGSRGEAGRGVVEDAAVSRSIGDVKAFWATRDAAAEFKQVLGPHAAFDIGLPVAAMDDYTRACRARLATEIPGCTGAFYGHIADGNLHIVACVPGAAVQLFDAIDAVVYGTVRDFGGTVSAEHGIGLKKKPFLPFTRNPEELALMRRIKNALKSRE